MEQMERQSAPDALRQQNARLQLLSQLAAGLMAAQDPVFVLQQIFNPIAGQFGIDVGFHYAVDGAGEELQLAAYLGITAEEAEQIERINYGQAICGTVALTRQPLHVSHIQQSDDPKLQFAKRHGVRACACYPLLIGERFLGVLFFGTYRRDAFDQSELDFFQTITQYLALAKERLRAEQAHRHERELLQKLFDRIPVMITSYRPDTRVVQLNRAFEQLTGWSTEEAREMDLMAACYPDPQYREEVRAFMASLEGWKDILMTTKTGEVIETAWSNIRLSDDTHIGIGIDLRESLQAQKALRESEERLRSAVEAADLGTWELDLERGLVSCDERTQALLGVALDGPVPYEQVLALVHPGDRQLAVETGEAATMPGSGGNYNAEKRVVRPDGEVRWAIVNGKTIFEGDGQATRIIGTVLDITERKRAEELLQAQKRELETKNQQLEGLFSRAPAGLALFGAEPPYEVLAHSEIYQQFFPEPFHSEGMLGKSIPDYVGAADLPAIFAIFEEVARTREAKTIFSFPVDTLPRGRTWWNWHLTPVFRDGEIVAFAHMAVEITEQVEANRRLEAELAERERAEKALAEERNLLRTILEAIPDYVYAKDLQSRFIVANSTVAHAAGVPSPDEVVGKTDFDLFPQELAAEYYADEQALIGSGRPLVNKDESVVEPDGSKKWILSTKVPLRDSEGQIVGLAGVGRDITERKRVEEALLELNATLEQKVRTRTQALEATNQELKLALSNEERARELFSTLFHTNPIPTAITRVADGLFIDVNEAHLRYFGYERDEMIGRTSLELKLLEPADRARLVAELRQTGHVRGRELLVRHPSGEIRNALFFAEPLAVDGESYLLASLVDISDRVRAEQLIRRLASELSLAEERERQRISQMLHDDVQQMLVALKVTLFLASEQADAATDATLQQAGEYVQELLRTTRSLTAELSAPTLKGDKLAEALSWLRGYMSERYGLQVHLILDAEGEIADRDKQAMIVRLVRELLFNVFKHAEVKEANLLVRETAEELLIRIEDKGRGFDTAPVMASASEESGFGLFSVRERLALLGGRFEIESAPGAGTRATIVIPKSLLS